MQKGSPQFYDGEQSILKSINPEWEDPREQRIHKDVQNDMMLDIENHLYDNGDRAQGMGYLGTGYLSAPRSKQGGIFPLIPIISGIASLLFGSGMSGGIANPLLLNRPPNMNNASSFFKDIMCQAVQNGIPQPLMKQKMIKLFGGVGMFNKVMTGKIGGGSLNGGPLKMGHLLSPIMMGHMMKALKGSRIKPRDVMERIENQFAPFLEKIATAEELKKGGSILSSLWSGAKSIFGKVGNAVKGLFGNKSVQEAASKIGSKVLERGSELAVKGLDKLSDYALKDMEKDPEITDEEIEKVQAELAKRKRKARAKQLLSVDDKRRRLQRRKTSRQEEEEEPEEEEEYTPSALRRFEQPSAVKSDTRRKALVQERRRTEPSRALVPVRNPSRYKRGYEEEEEEEEAPQPRNVLSAPPGMHVIAWNGTHPVYGYGYGKKKAYGGSWKVRLEKY